MHAASIEQQTCFSLTSFPLIVLSSDSLNVFLGCHEALLWKASIQKGRWAEQWNNEVALMNGFHFKCNSKLRATVGCLNSDFPSFYATNHLSLPWMCFDRFVHCSVPAPGFVVEDQAGQVNANNAQKKKLNHQD